VTTKNITSESKLTIGITFFASEQISNIWSNGTVQNVLFLYQLFEASDRVENVYLINGGDAARIPETLLPANMKPKLGRIEDLAHQLDVLIDFHVQVTPESEELVRANGGKIVQYKSGNVFVMELENSIFNLDRPNALMNGVQFDETWTLPHHERTCRSFLEVLNNAPVVVTPYLWSPVFMDWALEKTGIGQKYFYNPNERNTPQKRIAILEPNFNVVKSCHMPLLVCESAYRQQPQAFANIYVNNIEHMRAQKNFIHFTHYLDVTKDKIASYEGRYETPYFMTNHADVVVTHNWENQLNNLYFDVLYGGYPLVHNSEMLKNVGYYYQPFDARDGARVLLEAMNNHHLHLNDYQTRSAKLFEQANPTAQHNIDAHVSRLFGLFGVA
jgi:hypothetical protein